MRASKLQHIAILIAVLAVGYACVFFLTNFIDKNRPPLPESYQDEDMAFNADRLKMFSLGADGLIADWYWMNSLQYLGGKIQNAQGTINIEDLREYNPRLLYPMLDTATTLDPRFETAYSYGAIVLPAIEPQKAIDIAKKGIAKNPENWRLYQHLGYIYWRLKDFDKAAEAYEAGSRVPGAPEFFKGMAAFVKSESGSRDTARKIYSEMLASSNDSQSADMAKLRLAELDSLDERDAVKRVMQEFQSRNGRCTQSWNEILPLLRSVKLPNNMEFRLNQKGELVDPSGVAYLIDTTRCEILINTVDSKIPVR